MVVTPPGYSSWTLCWVLSLPEHICHHCWRQWDGTQPHGQHPCGVVGSRTIRDLLGNPRTIWGWVEEVYKKTQTLCPAEFWLALIFVHLNPPSATSQGSLGIPACAPQLGKLRLSRWEDIPAWPQRGATSIPLGSGDSLPSRRGGGVCVCVHPCGMPVWNWDMTVPSGVSSMRSVTVPSLSPELEPVSAAAATSPAPPSLGYSILHTPKLSQCPQTPPCTQSHLFN